MLFFGVKFYFASLLKTNMKISLETILWNIFDVQT